MELSDRRPLVAGIAVQRSVRPHQGETVIVVLDLRDRNLPATYRVTLFAIGAKLALVNIGVAIGAACPYIGEHRLGMALRAAHALVQSAQREFGLAVVVKFRDRPDRLPAFHRMAVLAGDIQVAVRAARIDIALGRAGPSRPCRQE